MLSRFLPNQVEPQVRAEQIRLLYDQGNAIQLLGIVTGLVAVGMFWPVADHAMLILWLCVHIALTLFRLRINVRFTTLHPTEGEALKKWGHIYVAGTLFSGLVWGSLCLFYDPSWPPAYQVILFVIYTGITAGVFNTNTPYFVAFPAFYLPPVLWLIFTLLHQAGEGFNALAALFAIYIVLMYVSALKYHNRFSNSLAIRFENEQMALKLAISNLRLEALADTDELTGMYNRRSMFKCLKSEWNRHYRSGTPLSLLYIDLDCFKQYNDSYGHEGGDQCLIKVAKVLRNNALRSSDMAARFGGEEFSLILPETNNEDAQKIAANILFDLERMNIPHTNSKVADRVTLSIGIATLIPVDPDNDEELREAADSALYQAKKEGRNRFVSHASSHTESAPNVTT